MTWLDLGVLAVLLLSIAWGVWRGLIRELFSVLGWIIAFLAANLLAGPLAAEMPDAIKAPDRKSTRLNSSHIQKSRMPSSA